MDIVKIYEYALQREREGKRFYEENAGRLGHAAAVEAFKTLAGQEEMHIYYVQAQIDALEEGKIPSAEVSAELERSGVFAQRAAAELLDQTVLEAMVPDLPVLRTAYLIERDFAEFYEMAAQQSEGEAREVLQHLAGWERMHEAFFKQLHDAAFEEYAQMPWGG
jgi:rubrerythrin